MSKVEQTLTGEQIKEWAEKDFIIAEVASMSRQNRSSPEDIISNGIDFGAQETGRYLYLSGHFPIKITRVPNQNVRKIGYIAGTNSDGSFHIYMLGNDDFDLEPSHNVITDVNLQLNFETQLLPPSDDRWTPSELLDYIWRTTSGATMDYRQAYAYNNNNLNNFISEVDSFEYHPQWGTYHQAISSYLDCAKINDDYLYDTQGIGSMDVTLTNDLHTLQLGVPMNVRYYQRSMSGMYYGDKNIGGDLYDLMAFFSQSFNNGVRNLKVRDVYHQETINGNTYNIINIYPYWEGSFAYHYTPYNLILTYDLDAAKNYINTGELPSDAFIYPFDVDNIPVNADGGTGAEDSDGTQDTVDTGDTTWEETDDQSPSAPGQNGQSLTNNNLYWLTSQQLKRFLDWFWDEATDVSDPSELFEKIQGLYENLSEAIVAVRYMPVRPEWIGGVSADTKIIVGMLEKTETVRIINKVVPDIQTIGSIDIRELAKDNKTWDGFLNYSPYCQMSLYLPFHGFIDLDADLIMNSKLTIKAAYDILTGTIQYFIYRTARGADNLNLVNTVVAKMATDIPISLQTKTQRDSAIFQNVSSAAGNLIGAGASLATGNPIGMVMSTANIAATQPTGAPLTLKGTISENGAYYDSALCAIYVKRPGINIPSNYDRKVGNPCNVAMKLSSVHGFVKCENPFISFSEVTSDNSLGFPPPKPTKDEIDTIYNALSEGVILP